MEDWILKLTVPASSSAAIGELLTTLPPNEIKPIIQRALSQNSQIVWSLLEAAEIKVEPRDWILVQTIAKGYKQFTNGPDYTKFLNKMVEITKSTSFVSESNNHQPCVLSVIVLFSFLNFVQRYTNIYTQPTEDFQTLELKLIQTIIKNPKYLKFPLVYLADYIMNIFQGPKNGRKIAELTEVSYN
jgi:hypothetical protein